MDMLTEGAIVAGRYRVGRPIAEGAMGAVYNATHLVLDHEIALKVMLHVAARRDEVVGRFDREAWALARLRGPHTPRVFDAGRLPDDVPFIALERLDGEELETLLRRRHRLELEEAVDLLLQACEGLAEAHRLGIVHRDVKPSNLFLCAEPDGRRLVKVIDFGISKITTGTDAAEEMALTGEAVALGSPPYMPPEQFRSAREVDARADLWSLGVVLWRSVSGEAPFPSECFEELVDQIINGAPAPWPNEIVVPQGVHDVLARLLAKQPADRFPDVAALAEALSPFASENGRSAVARVRSTLAHGGAALPTRPRRPGGAATVLPATQPQRWTRRRAALASSLVGLTLGAIGWRASCVRARRAPGAALVAALDAAANADQETSRDAPGAARPARLDARPPRAGPPATDSPPPARHAVTRGVAQPHEAVPRSGQKRVPRARAESLYRRRI